jgi:asparagine synthase (glutamine-hydrolysing)
MCGIAGYIGRTVDQLLPRMIDAIRPRGPDGDGDFISAPVHFGHTRLAIIDLVSGAQPMVRREGRAAITYNGEIYNYIELRQDIEAAGFTFETKSDTEVILLGYLAFGPDFFKRMIGIFAFALADLEKRRVLLVRDHFGIKPLYYAKTKDALVFSSSARAVALHSEVDRSLDPAAIRDYLQFRYVPNGQHFFSGIRTLPAGSILTYDFDGTEKIEQYWTAAQRRPDDRINEETWITRTLALLDDAVRIQLRSDVPVGLFLSGGVDSSTIATFGTRHAAARMTAYTYAMEGDHDEVAAAGDIARQTGVDHRIVRGEGAGALSGLRDAIACMDLPVGDAIIVPTYRLCEAAARDLKVVLTGEGADEVFGGYVHFSALFKLARLSRAIPFAHRLAGGIELLPIALLNHFFDYQASLGSLGRTRVARMIRSIHGPTALYRMASSVIDDDEIVAAANLGPAVSEDIGPLTLPNLMAETARTWLPYQILNKMDQLSMAHGLEARVPFLDPRIYDHVLSAPDSLFLSGSANKVLLRKALAQAGGLNANRPKFAFHVPIEQRYRAELDTMCADWLSDEQIERHGILKRKYVKDNIAALRSGEFLASKRLVTMIGLHMWLDEHQGVGSKRRDEAVTLLSGGAKARLLV